MATIEAKDYEYRYADDDKAALSIRELSIEKGELVLLIGASASGKTTLLRRITAHTHASKEQAGDASKEEQGLRGKESGALESRAKGYGYVWQNPSAQMVCHLVEQEIVFGMENLGVPVEDMQRRLAEVVTFFGLEHLLHRETSSLSAGEQQMVNIAGAMAMRPELLLLDEPTSALDPMAAGRLAGLIRKIHEETGCTILIAEQRPEPFFEMADRILEMKSANIIFDGDFRAFLDKGASLFLPKTIRMAFQTGADPDVAMSRRKIREWLAAHNSEIQEEGSATDMYHSGPDIELKNVCFRYAIKAPDVLKECSLSIHTGRITALVGGNGSGKTTLAEVIGGYLKPYAGRVKRPMEAVSYLPSDPAYLFTDDPEELSGGENEMRGVRFALEKSADLLILDEPTKGLDPDRKNELIRMLLDKKKDNKTVLLVTHDIEFAAECADDMAMMFDGRVVTCEKTKDFLKGNIYYTTELQRLLSWG